MMWSRAAALQSFMVNRRDAERLPNLALSAANCLTSSWESIPWPGTWNTQVRLVKKPWARHDSGNSVFGESRSVHLTSLLRRCGDKHMENCFTGRDGCSVDSVGVGVSRAGSLLVQVSICLSILKHGADDKVCRPWLCGLCPNEMLDNTKISMGACPKVHAQSLKDKYEAEIAKVSLLFTIDFMLCLTTND